MTSDTWTAEDDATLRKLALSGIGMSEIAERMSRTKSKVRTRAARLQIAIARSENPMQRGKTAIGRLRPVSQ